MPQSTARVFRQTTFVATSLLCGLALVWAGSQSRLELSFARALAPDGAGTVSADQRRRSVAAVSAGEDYWLGRVSFDDLQPAALRGVDKPRKALKVGDRVTIETVDGVRVLEVMSVTRLPAGLLPATAGTAAADTPFDMVSLRDTNSASPRLVRWLLEAGDDDHRRSAERAL